jgi:hypothetical protein
MSNALAIAGVTAVLRDLLDSGMIDHEITDAMGQGVTVSAVAPDSIPLEGTSAKPQLNVFMYQATPNAALRNRDLPARARDGSRIANPPLSLDLHYLITAYGISDLQADILLGYAMHLLHETPMLGREAIRKALNPPAPPVSGAMLPAVYQALRASDLAEQIEMVKLTPAPMNTEELSKLWSAMQAHYRPSAAYTASVVMIEAQSPARSPLPVLTRGPRIPAPSDPTRMIESGVRVTPSAAPQRPLLETIELPDARLVAQLGDAITLRGAALDGSSHALLLSRPRDGFELVVTPASSFATDRVGFVLPNLPTVLQVGVYLVCVRLQRPDDTQVRPSNELELRIAPRMTSLTNPPQQFARAADGSATIAITCTPEVLPGQRASLIIGQREVAAQPRASTTGNLSFVVVDAPVGIHHVRLRVEGIDSALVDRDAQPPVFFDQRIEIV